MTALPIKPSPAIWRAIPGVAQVNVVGVTVAQLNINVRPGDSAAAGVGIDQVVTAVRSQNLARPVGNVNSAMEQRSIRLEGRFEQPDDFAALVISSPNGQLIKLGQVASVEAGARAKSSALFSGKTRSVSISVKSREYSTTSVADGVKARIAQLQPHCLLGRESKSCATRERACAIPSATWRSACRRRSTDGGSSYSVLELVAIDGHYGLALPVSCSRRSYHSQCSALR